ncbi:MAG: 4-hydroxy-tetrahydrodipicolinate synthase [Thermodesulfobacteriota bacterium]
MFKGAMTALVTPFKDGNIDEATLRMLIERQIEGGIDGLVPCGTTGESATLTHEEHRRVIEITVETAGGRVPVIAGTGSNSTTESVILTKFAKEAGADAALLITPYYNKPSQEGLYQHYKTVAESVEIPIMLYNVPGRTAVNMSPETTARLSKIETIFGIKEATGDLKQVEETIRLAQEGFILLSGDDESTLPILSIGGSGAISVTSNLVPADVANMYAAFNEERLQEAQEIHERLLPLSSAMFIETNPVPVKTALAMMELIGEALRLPLVEMGKENKEILKKALEDYGLLK